MNYREADGFRQALRRLATPRVVEFTAADMRKIQWAADRRTQGKPSQIKDVTVLGRVASLIRSE